MQRYSAEPHVNVGSGQDIPILDLARLVCEVVGFTGEIRCDLTKPDGTPRKLMSGAVLQAMGWRPRIGLREGVAGVYGERATATLRNVPPHREHDAASR